SAACWLACWRQRFQRQGGRLDETAHQCRQAKRRDSASEVVRVVHVRCYDDRVACVAGIAVDTPGHPLAVTVGERDSDGRIDTPATAKHDAQIAVGEA